jgi:hypothetical protein
MVFMPGSALWAAAIAASIRADDRVDQRRNALVDFELFVSSTASFRLLCKLGGHVIADGFLMLYPPKLRCLMTPAGLDPATVRV